MGSGELNKRIRFLFDKPKKEITFKDLAVIPKMLEEAKADIFNEIGDFDYKEPYDYNLQQLKVRYEETSRKLIAVTSKLLRWFGAPQ